MILFNVPCILINVYKYNLTGLVTKGYFGCKCCGPSLKARWSKDLRKTAYNYSRVFLPEEHPYRRETSTLNGKQERTQRPPITTPAEWIREYEREKEKEFIELLNSNGEPMFDDPEFFDTYVEKFPIGMKRKYIFYSLHIWSILRFITGILRSKMGLLRKFKIIVEKIK